MINGKKVLCVIPARGGSKGIPRKNIRIVGGKPLITFTVEVALKSNYIDKVVVSSEDKEILSIAGRIDATPLTRPAELSRDNTPGVEAVLHAIDQFPGYDYVVLLQPTSPLRLVEDIDNSLALCNDNNFPCSVSVCEAQ